jgi:hypothetical protein
MKDEYGEDSDVYAVRVLGEFPKNSDLQFIDSHYAVKSLKMNYPEQMYCDMPKILGVDVAAFGSDHSVIVERQGLRATLLWRVKGNTDGYEFNTLEGEIASLLDTGKYAACFIDQTGVGAGIVSHLRTRGYKSIGVNFGGAAQERSKYRNKRAEMWATMKDWIVKTAGWIDCQGDTKLEEQIRVELTSPEYNYDNVGRLQLERKEDMKKRGLKSPDISDALALTFAHPVSATLGVNYSGRSYGNYRGRPIAGRF